MGDNTLELNKPANEQRMTRRQALRRSAVLGGAVVWSTPAVQSLARPAFANQGTPESDWSYIAVVVQRDDQTHCSFKFDRESGTTGLWSQGGRTPDPACSPDQWDQRSNCTDEEGRPLTGAEVFFDPFGPDGACFWTVEVRPEFVDSLTIVAASIKQATECHVDRFEPDEVIIGGDKVRLRPPRHDC